MSWACLWLWLCLSRATYGLILSDPASAYGLVRSGQAADYGVIPSSSRAGRTPSLSASFSTVRKFGSRPPFS
jgi:hypothetical protein